MDVRSFPRIDINKGDDKKPNSRSRLVGKEIKKDKRLDLFAATRHHWKHSKRYCPSVRPASTRRSHTDS